MIKCIGHIVVVVLAGYLAMVGCGFNVQHYCSVECAEHHECCHHHHHTCHCGVEIGEACHCGVTHIAAPEAVVPVHNALVPDVCCHVICVGALVAEPKLTAFHNQFHICHAPPILSGGRDVISRKSVLLI